ncbi:MAG: ABC transporter permease [Bryobacterales bacterium]|nr:ABC transporter permease [Bryobacterales bacterium]MDE0629587.1 ABC transporter permease [Bryobacterales bacterium]
MTLLYRSFRSLWRQPLLFAASVATLAVGLAVCSVGVSLLESILLQPLPYPEADRLAMVWNVRYDNPGRRLPVSRRTFGELDGTARSFTQVAAARDWSFVTPGSMGTEQRLGALVSDQFLTMLGAPIAAGRRFTSEDLAGDVPNAVVLSHRFWLERFGGDGGAIGTSIVLDNRPFTVVGILGEAFLFPPWPNVDIWAPLTVDPDQRAFPDKGNLWVLGRLRPSATLAEAQAETDLVAARLAESARAGNDGLGARVVALHEQLVGASRAPLVAVWSATLLVFLIACCNVVGLLVARWLAQRREFAVRAAVGASPIQMLRVIACDVFWITALGAAAGLPLSAALIEVIAAMNPTLFPRMQEVGVHWAGASFTVAVGTMGIVGFSLPSVLRTVRFRIAERLKLQRSESRHLFRKWSGQDSLIALESALAFAMVTATLLMIQTVVRIQSFDLGFDPSGVLTARLPFSFSDYPTEERLHAHYRTLLDRVGSQPGVSHVGASTALPLSGVRETIPVSVDNAAATRVQYAQVSSGYFATMRIPILRGREFSEIDDASSFSVCIADAAFAQSHFGGGDPVGSQLAVGDAPSSTCSIVGVVGNVRQFGPLGAHEPMVYFPLLQRSRWASFIAVRAESGSAAGRPGAFRRTVSTVDGNQVVADMRTMEERLGARLRRPRFTLMLFAWFGLVALGLGIVGVYSVTSYVTRRRSKDHGIQLALGASPARVARSVVARGLRPVLVGLLGGLAAAVSFGRLLEGQLYGVSPLDPISMVAGSLILILSAVTGSFLPAWRASRADPLQAIRTE